MNAAASLASGLTLGVAIVGAACDCRSGEIPNWLTLPPLLVAPLAYGLAIGPEHAARSLAAACLNAAIPYLLFRRGGMGGGDVKIFGAIGAVTGLDPFLGLEIQLSALCIAMLFALGALAWRGQLLRTLTSALAQLPRVLRRRSDRPQFPDDLSAPIRMGVPIVIATGIHVGPPLLLAWGRI